LIRKQLQTAAEFTRNAVVPLVACCVIAGLHGCATEAVLDPAAHLRLVVVSGDKQTGRAGGSLTLPLTVRAEDPVSGAGVKGVRIRFAVDRSTSATAFLEDSAAVTDDRGIAEARLTLGTEPGPSGVNVGVVASIAAEPSRSVRFTASAVTQSRITLILPTPLVAGETIAINGENLSGTRIRVRFGSVAFDVPPTAAGNTAVLAVVPACLGPGTTSVSLEIDGYRTNAIEVAATAGRAALTLAPHQRVTLPASRLAECVSLGGNGATYLVTGQFASVGSPDRVAWQLGSPGSAVEVALVSEPRPKPLKGAIAHRAFEAGLRSLEQRVIPEARAQRTNAMRGVASSLVAPPEVGSLRSFQVTTRTDGSEFATVTARLRFAGARVLAYADTSFEGFSGAQLQALASLYDRELVGEAVRAFGSEPDVDGNGRIIVLFTPAVNRLARPEDCLLRGFVTGYFYPVDQLERQAHSNRGEIFYSLVPDPEGRHSCSHTETEVLRLIQPAFLHEMQHLISLNQRVLTRGADFEEPWLNEGLSQIAEELGSRIFESRYPPPLGRSTSTQIFPDSAGVFIAPQMLNAYVYLTFALEHSVTSYAGNGSLEERGASWLFLRWLADQKGEGVLKRLVQSSRRGIANVEAVSGESFGELFGDFSMALFADSLPGFARSVTSPRLRFTTRNLRQLMAREATIAGFGPQFPITTYLLERGGLLRGAMPPGTILHAILRSKPGDGPLRLSFQTGAGAPFGAGLGGQVSVLRLPP
jgi:hypothetical protein